MHKRLSGKEKDDPMQSSKNVDVACVTDLSGHELEKEKLKKCT